MAFSILKDLLEKYIASLVDEGTINEQFLSNLEQIEGPENALQLITTYLTDVEALLSELSSHIGGPGTNLSMLVPVVQKIEEKSFNIGVEHVRRACPDLIVACEERQIPHFDRALIWLRNEFDNTQRKLDAIIQMERRILRVKSKQEQGGASSSLDTTGQK